MRRSVVGIAIVGLILLLTAPGGLAAGASSQAAASDGVEYVAGSTVFVCDLVGFPDSPEPATVGLLGNGLGYSFEYRDRLWWLFGDSHATTTFGGLPNAATRWPQDRRADGNDSIATSSLQPPGICPTLDFLAEKEPVAGAYANESVSPDPGFGTESQVSLRTNETPLAGVSVGKRNPEMFVAFSTDNPCDVARLKAQDPHKYCGTGGNDLGRSTRSVIGSYEGVSSVNGTTAVRFKGLFDLSAPATRYGDGAKFLQAAMQPSPDGQYIYIWGTQGGHETGQSAPYLARIPDDPNEFTRSHLTYFDGIGRNVFGGKITRVPLFGHSETNARPLFASACMAFLGLQYNPYVQRWIMLYECPHRVSTPGIYMRTAPQPWGPWSAQQLIFNPAPNPMAQTGYCYFLYSPPNTKGLPDCADYPGSPNPQSTVTPGKPPDANKGVYFAPEFIPNWTTGTKTTSGSGTTITSTFYFTISTLNPYGEVIVKSTVRQLMPNKSGVTSLQVHARLGISTTGCFFSPDAALIGSPGLARSLPHCNRPIDGDSFGDGARLGSASASAIPLATERR